MKLLLDFKETTGWNMKAITELTKDKDKELSILEKVSG